MADLHSPHDNTDIRINSKINFYGPVILSVTGPLMLIVLVFFTFWAITSWSHVGMVAAIVVYAGLGIIGVAMLVGIVGVGVRWVAIPLIHAHQRHIEAQGQYNRNKLIHIQDNAAVIENAKGDVEVIPLLTMQQRDIFHHKPELQQLPEQAESLIAPPPDYVRYEDVKHQIPRGHTLIGVGAGDQVLTKDKGARAMVWIVGNSGTGKTNTIMLRVDEDYEDGAHFLGVDPHFFKDESLANAITGTKYEARFRTPDGNAFDNGTRFASELEDITTMCDVFINEFERRRTGGTWQSQLRLVMDEVSTLTYKPLTQQEKDVVAKIQRVAQIAGQQARNFGMGCIMISQQATGMAWLRRYTLLVFAHQLLMQSEKELACNGNVEMAKAMTSWPVGRTAVYGIAMGSEIQEVQQPLLLSSTASTQKTFPASTEHEKKFSVDTDMQMPIDPLPMRPVDGRVDGGRRVENAGKTDYTLTVDEQHELIELYQEMGNIDKALRQMKKSNRYHATAARIIKEAGI